MPLNESYFVRKLKTYLEAQLPQSVVIKHADAVTAGIPDLSVSWNHKTTWLEVKVSRNGGPLRDREVQRLSLRRMGTAASCYYVIFEVGNPRTIIVPPSRVSEWMSWPDHVMGHNYGYIINFVKELHS